MLQITNSNSVYEHYLVRTMDDTNKFVRKKIVCDAVIKNILTEQVNLKHVNFDNFQVLNV